MDTNVTIDKISRERYNDILVYADIFVIYKINENVEGHSSNTFSGNIFQILNIFPILVL